MPRATATATIEPRRKRREGPRVPSRGRGILRYTALLDATEELLHVDDPDAIGLYQIAERAGVPPASAYHFFPTKEAAFVALAERYAARLVATHRTPIEASSILNWPDLFGIDARRAMDFYNANRPALKIFYGGYGGVEGRKVDRVTMEGLAQSSYARANRIFHMPYLSDTVRPFEVRLSILDAIWTSSVQRHGMITDEYHHEAYAACIAYFSLYLPGRIERRDVLVRAAERGQSIVLPFDEAAIRVV
jgi:AcrR family transcriptional regulator